MLNRRDFLKLSGLVALASTACTSPRLAPAGVMVNDVHSQLNPTRVNRILGPSSVADVQATLAQARNEGRAVCIAGARHAMGAQQFATDALLLDMANLNRVLHFDRVKGLIEVEAGMQWPELVDYLITTQRGGVKQWGIAQKQTGADKLSIGGCVGSNIHGRGLRMAPFVSNIESLQVVDGQGRVHNCSRRENADLFRLVVGGYGLFGVVTAVTLRLTPRRKLRRVVEILDIDDVMPAFRGRIAEGYLYGDFQYSIDEKSPDYLRKGVFSCYLPVADDTPMPDGQKELAHEDWVKLLYLAHADERRAFQVYADYYLATSGQLYWSDTHQLSIYPENYHAELDRRLGAVGRATEIITQMYVPRARLADFMHEAADDFRRHRVEVIYGTVRLIERDVETFLAWAKQPYACVIFNLHTEHTPEGIERSGAAFRRLNDMAIARSGSYFLTYHKFATRDQLLACYPQFPEFLRRKRQHDPHEVFQSDWYRYYKKMFADLI